MTIFAVFLMIVFFIGCLGLAMSLITRKLWVVAVSALLILVSSIGTGWLITDTKGRALINAENELHSNLLSLVEGRYILDTVVSSDSAKVRFILRLPGIAKRKVEVIAYNDHPSVYWNEWQAEGAENGDTLIVWDVWNTDSTYSRVVQKMDASQIGLGYISNDWLVEHGYEEPPKK